MARVTKNLLKSFKNYFHHALEEKVEGQVVEGQASESHPLLVSLLGTRTMSLSQKVCTELVGITYEYSALT